jgi:hypothetical protein
VPTVRGSVQNFDDAVAAIRAVRLRPELQWEEAPAPTRIAPHTVAITADVVVGDDELATGRLVLLHDPAGHEAWEGTFRLVAYVRADVEAELVTDALLGTVAWSWLTEALTVRGADQHALSGTVTRVSSEGFGGMVEDPAQAQVEIRASWTPTALCEDDSDPDLIAGHVLAWGDLMATAAGLPSVPDGVSTLQPRRRARF